MTMIPIICYRCTQCNRLYEEPPQHCVCERVIFTRGERFGPFIVEEKLEDGKIRVKCLLCDSFHSVRHTNIRKYKSCGCKPLHIETLELTSELIIYRCKKCGKTSTRRLPIVSYCCEESNDPTDSPASDS